MSVKAKLKTAIPDFELEFELEGAEDDVKKQIASLVEYFGKMLPVGSAAAPTKKAMNPKNSASEKRNAPVVKRKLDEPQFLSDLLSVDEIRSLKEYYQEKMPAAHSDKFVVAALWLRENKKCESVSIDEIWTVYKAIGEKAPRNLVQVFRDGKSKRGHFDFVSDGRYKITSVGEMHVLHDLPMQKGEKQ